MAIAYDQMPEANQQKAIDIFGRQMRGEITQAQAEAEAGRHRRTAMSEGHPAIRGPFMLANRRCVALRIPPCQVASFRRQD